MKILKVAALTSALLMSNAFASDIYVDLDDGGLTPTQALETLNVIYDSHTTINLAEYAGTGSGTVKTVAGFNAIGEDFGFLSSPIFSDFDTMVGCSFACGTQNTIASDPNYLASPFGSEYTTSGMALSFGIDLDGTFDGTNLNYTDGILDIYSYNQADPETTYTKVFTSSFVSGSVLSGEQRVSTLLSDSTEVLVDDTFFLEQGGSLISFEDYLDSSPFADIRIAIQQFVNQDQLAIDIAEASVLPAANNGAGLVHVTALHNASVTFDVPEPTSIAILGLGLLGLAGARRRKA